MDRQDRIYEELRNYMSAKDAARAAHILARMTTNQWERTMRAVEAAREADHAKVRQLADLA